MTMIVRYYGHIGQLTGYGRAGADLCMALLATGKVALEIAPINRPSSAEAREALARYEPLRSCLRADHDLTEPDVCIVHTLPMDCERVRDRIQGEAGGHLDPLIPWVAYTTWEGCGFVPLSIQLALAEFEQVWSPSTASLMSFFATEAEDRKRFKCVPHAFDPSELEQRRVRVRRDGELWQAAPGPSLFRFYYSGAWTSRKNPAGILRAWAKAFRGDEEVCLVLHVPGATQELCAIALHQTGLTPKEMAPVSVIRGRLGDQQYMDLHRSCDVFVTATRGEAWNLPAFDAVLSGRHVIHPMAMGPADYLGATSAVQYGGMAAPAAVDVQVTERMEDGVRMAVIGAQGLSSRSEWIEPNLAELAAEMRNAFECDRRSLTVDYDLASRYGYPAVGKTALDLLEDL